MTKQEVLDQCKIKDNVVFLPDVQLDRPLYMEVNKALQGIGGKWNRNKKGFVFTSDPSTLMGRVQQGEKINLKKDFQFFETPDELADQLVELAELDGQGKYLEDAYAHTILEPSAGRGAIIKAIKRKLSDGTIVYAHELMENNRKALEDMVNVRLSRNPDFLSNNNMLKFNRIIANPPFTKNQDIDHVKKMYEGLKLGGIMVSVMSNHWRISENKKETQFRQWIEKVNAEIIDVPAGTFKSSGTSIATCIVKIKKNALPNED
jgi:hypothetical protein